MPLILISWVATIFLYHAVWLALALIPVMIYLGYVARNWTREYESIQKERILVLDQQGARIIEGEDELWSVDPGTIAHVQATNAFRPAPDTLGQLIDDLFGKHYESSIQVQTGSGSKHIPILVRSFYEGNEIRRWSTSMSSSPGNATANRNDLYLSY